MTTNLQCPQQQPKCTESESEQVSQTRSTLAHLAGRISYLEEVIQGWLDTEVEPNSDQDNSEEMW